MFVAQFSAGAYITYRTRDALRALAVLASMGVVVFYLFGSSAELPGDVILFQVFSLAVSVAPG